MSKYARRDTRDANHNDIVRELRKMGVEVIETERPVDVLIHHRGLSGWGEIKVEGGAVKRGQVKFMSETKMPVAFIRSTEDAVRFAETFEGLSAGAKERLAGLLAAHPNDKTFTPKQIEAVLAGQVVRKKAKKILQGGQKN